MVFVSNAKNLGARNSFSSFLASFVVFMFSENSYRSYVVLVKVEVEMHRETIGQHNLARNCMPSLWC